MPGRGIQDLVLNRIPEKWNREWFGRFIREVLALADTRNAIEGSGITITGQPNERATVSASDDLQNLLLQSFVLAQPSGFLQFERTLAGDEGVHVVDGGPNANITVKLLDHGTNLGKLQQLGAWAVLANPTNALINVQSVQATLDGQVFTLQGTDLGFTLTPTWRGDHKWVDNVGLIFGTGDDVVAEFDGTDFSIAVTGGTQHVATGDYEIAALTFKVATDGNDRFEIDEDGAWLIGGSAGTAGYVPVSAGAGAAVTWAAQSGGGGGAVTSVGEVAVAGAAATVLTIGSLDLAADECYEVDLVLDNATGSAANISMTYNADTTATNYDRNISTDGGAAGTTNNALIPGLPASSGVFTRIVIRPDFDGRARSVFIASGGNTTATVTQTGQHLWRTVANVTSITFTSSVANAFSIGSKVQVWKRTS